MERIGDYPFIQHFMEESLEKTGLSQLWTVLTILASQEIWDKRPGMEETDGLSSPCDELGPTRSWAAEWLVSPPERGDGMMRSDTQGVRDRGTLTLFRRNLAIQWEDI